MPKYPNQFVTQGTLMERAYRSFAQHTAVIEDDRRVTFAELGHRAYRVADALRRAGVDFQDRVIILSKNRTEFWEVEHGIAIGGFIRVALATRLHPQEVEYIGNDCTSVVAFVDSEWADKLASVRASMPSLRLVVGLDGANPARGIVGYHDFLSGADAAAPDRRPTADHLSALLYTSGTTGRPKGAMQAHGSLVAMLRSVQTHLPPIDPSDVVLHVAPLTHMSGGCAFTYFTNGATQTMLPTFEPHDVLRTVETLRVTAIPLVPTMLNLLTEAAEETPHDVSSVRAIIYGASAIAPDRLVRALRIFGPIFVQLYGLSEVVMPLASLHQREHELLPDGSPPKHLASTGRPHPFFELRIVDDDGIERPPGQHGEIAVRSDTMMEGYWNQPDQTAEMIDSDGWAHTGDVGYLDVDGYLYIVDRKKDMIVSGGFNVYPNEVEHAISKLIGVQEVAVVGTPDDRWGEAVTAVVVRRVGYDVTEADVIQSCRASLASYKAPKQVLFWDTVPKSPVGKILRREVREVFWADRDRKVN